VTGSSKRFPVREQINSCGMLGKSDPAPTFSCTIRYLIKCAI